MAVDYFRRPQLVGKNIVRTTTATIRGSIRRTDPDGTSTVPYFPGVTAAMTLFITHQAGSVTATMAGSDMTGILAAINTALGANGVASDADGTIQISSSVAGSTGFVQVTGGTASALLGFQTYGGAKAISARGAEIPSAPESRAGNLFGVAFPSKRENFINDILVRSMGRIAGNSDVLWFDHIKDQAQLQPVAFSVGTAGAYIVPTSTQRMLVGSPAATGLSASSLKKGLIPYYQLIDNATGLPAQSQVVAVVRGVPVGDPPYANSPSWTDTTGRNVLGLSQTKVSAATITAIDGGKYVTCSGVTFITTGVTVGDFFEVAGATNTAKGSNNGNRWIVEEVVSETVVAVRPMSKSELVAAGTSVNDFQPILELNDVVSGPEVFGTATIRNGLFAQNVTLVVRPPIPTGASYQLLAAIPNSLRDVIGYENRSSNQAPLLDIASAYPLVHDGSISGLAASLSGGNCVLTAGIIRWNGRVYGLPATTFLPGAFTNGVNYVYWDDVTTNLKLTQNPNDFRDLYNTAVTTNKGHLLAIVVVGGGVITSVTPCNRLVADAGRIVTVGPGGQFSNLDDAINYVSQYASAYGEMTTASGQFPHTEILIVGDTAYDGSTSSLIGPSITIRGAHKAVTLTITAGITLNSCPSIEIRDLTIIHTAAPGTIDAVVRPRFGGNAADVRLINVTFGGSGSTQYVVKFGNSATPGNVFIDNCSFRLLLGIMSGTPVSSGTGELHLRNSKFTFTGSGTPQMIIDDSATTSSIGKFTANNCTFDGAWLTTSGTAAMVIQTSDSTSQVVFENCFFALGAHTSSGNASLFNIGGLARIRNVQIVSGKIPRPVIGNLNTIIEDSVFLVNPEGSSATAIVAGYVRRCTITHQDTDAATQGASAIQPLAHAVENTLTGPFFRAISTATNSNVRVAGNKIVTGPGTHATATQTAIYVNGGSHIEVHDNFVQSGANGLVAANVFCVEFGSTGSSDVSISGNTFGIAKFGTLVGGGGTHSGVSIIGNTGYVYNDDGAANSGTGIDAHIFARCLIANNNIQLNGATATYTGIKLSGTNEVNITGNYIEASSTPFDGGGGDGSDTWTVTANTFAVGVHATGGSQSFGGLTTGNRFINTASGSHTVDFVSGLFRDNEVIGNVNLAANLGNFECENNFISGWLDGTLHTPTYTTAKIVGNYVQNYVSMEKSSNIGDLIMSDNYVINQMVATQGGGRVTMVGNQCDRINLNMGTTALSVVIVNENKTFTQGITLLATRMEVIGNDVATSMVLQEGFTTPGTRCHVAQNTSLDVLTQHEFVRVIGNTMGQYIHQRTAGSSSKVFFEYNTCNGDFTCNPTSGVTYRIEDLVVKGNYFNEATITTWSAVAQNCWVCDNYINPLNGPTIEIGGSLIHASGNVIYASTFSAGTNANTLVEFTSLTALSRSWIENNWIYGHVTVETANGGSEVWFSGNYVYNLGSSDAVTFGAVTGSTNVSDNVITQDDTSISNGSSSCINFSGSASHTRIIGNSFSLAAFSASYAAPATFAMVEMNGGANAQVTFNGNQFNKPSDATVTGNAVVCNYLTLLNASSVVVNVNTMSHAGTPSANTEHRGGLLAFVVGPATVTVAQ